MNRKSILFCALLTFCAVVASLPFAGQAADESASAEEGWVSLFDGAHLTDWEASERPFNWTAEDGALVGRGSRSHLFYTGQEFTDFEFEAEVKLNHGGNSGMYFRALREGGWPRGYEAQVNNSHRDPRRTGSLYRFVDVLESKIADDTWWKQSIRCEGNHITIKVNDEVVVDFVDKENTYRSGFLALQQHDPGSTVAYRNLRVRPLVAQ
jgi:hypothetical protein